MVLWIIAACLVYLVSPTLFWLVVVLLIVTLVLGAVVNTVDWFVDAVKRRLTGRAVPRRDPQSSH